MDTKKALIAGVLVVAAGAAAVAGGIVPNPFVTTGPAADPPIEAYASPMHGLAFVYPAEYDLREIPLANEGVSWTAITLADREVLRQAEENGASEGPPLIAIQIFDNTENQTAEEWVRASKFSNFSLSPNGVLATTTVSGVGSVLYVYSGLYTSDVVVTAHNGNIYMFLVDWLTQEDKNLWVFDGIMGSVQFI